MKNKYILISMLVAAFLSWLPAGARAQQDSYAFEWNQAQNNYYSTLSMEAEDGAMILAAFDGTVVPKDSPASVVHARLFRISTGGELLNEYLSDRLLSIAGLYAHPDGGILVVGTAVDETTSLRRPYLAHLSADLELVSETEVELPDTIGSIVKARSIFDDDDNIFFCGICPNSDTLPSGTIRYNKLYMTISMDGNVEQMTLCADHQLELGYVGDIFKFADGSGDFGHVYYWLDGWSHIPALNRITPGMDVSFVSNLAGGALIHELQGDEILWVGWEGEDVIEAMSLPDSTLLISDRTRNSYENEHSGNFSNWDISTLVFKSGPSSGPITDYTILGFRNDSTDIQATICGMDQNAQRYVYQCSYSYSDPYTYNFSESEIVLTKMKWDMSIVWQKKYSNDKKRMLPMCVKATSDGGCFISGYCDDAYDGDKTVFGMKIDADGMFGVDDFALTESVEMEVFPNPADGVLRMRLLSDAKPVGVELYDASGRMVMEVRRGFENMNIATLPAGQYMVKVTVDNGRTYTKKIVKK